MLVKLITKKTAESFAEAVRDSIPVGGRLVHRDSRVKFVKLKFVSGVLCPTLSDYDKSRNRIETSGTGGCVLHEQRTYANHGFCAERKMMTSFALIRNKSDEDEE